MSEQLKSTPIQKRIGSVFIPVRDIEKARSWYCRVFGWDEQDVPVLNGHLCPLPLDGTGIILDTMPKWGGDRPEGAPPIETPALMLPTGDLEGAYAFMKAAGAEPVTGMEDDYWFVVKDPDGNKLMICKE
ncbi:VOC family protein [Gorillibacterium sp. sgz500922]|uniref:VOC family protein n=1 Tax=Gorillibacterium sp. sgz500922 TaxID=3446694 RepID=UPI003F681E90